MMTKEDIKKAFDICSSAQKSCNGCPLLVLEKQNGRGCKYNLFTSVLDLVTEQEKEIERVKAENEKVYAVRDNLLKENDELIKTNAELLLLPKQAVKQAKIDVLNELIDKMFEREYMGVKYKERIFYENEINDMIAEVQNAEDKS